MSNEGRSTNDQIVPASSQALPSSLGLGNSFVIGISSVVGRRPNSQTPNPKRQRNPKHQVQTTLDRKSTRLNSSHSQISYAVFCLKKKKKQQFRDIHNH